MSICPYCKGEGTTPNKDPRTAAENPLLRCWYCHGNGNDTAKDFYDFRDHMRKTGQWKA